MSKDEVVGCAVSTLLRFTTIQRLCPLGPGSRKMNVVLCKQSQISKPLESTVESTVGSTLSCAVSYGPVLDAECATSKV